MTTPEPSPAELPEPGDQRDERRFVHALARGLSILEAFDSERELGVAELAGITAMPATTVGRFAYTLAELGYLRQVRSGRYVPGAGFLGLSASINRNLGMQRVARPYLDALARDLDCTAIVGMHDRNAMVFLEVARPRTAIVVNTDAGSRIPILTTAMGLAYLVAAPLPERAHLLEALRPRTPDWQQARERIEKAYTSYARRGFVLQERSASREVNAVACPLVSEHAHVVYTFMCGGPSSTTPRRLLAEEIGPRLVQTVKAVARELERTPLLRLPKAPL
ncbi:IclR family transcriptional regulator [Verticiella sediminum]|nr:helix-turn-helix domain-containing protein [Verticiella sediminum]